MTATAPQTVPTTAELVARARELAPLLQKNAAAGEQDRRVAQESIRALTEAGLFKIATPKRYGGYETSMRTMLEVSAAVAEADGGTAWVVTLANVMAWVVGLFPERVQDEVFGADPDAKVSGVLSPTAETHRVEGGWRVSGKWYYNSGSLHADWAGLGIPITDEDGAVVDQGMALIPRSDLDLEDTWFVAGMRSSGSNCLVASDVFVPEHRVMRVPPAITGDYPTEHTEETLYRSALVPVLALVLVGPQLGMGRAALDLVVGKAAVKPISYTFFTAQQESVAFQLQIAEAARLIDTAQLIAHRAATDIDEAAARGEYPDQLTRARVRSDTGYIAESITRAIDILLSAHGAGSFAEVNPLQRIWRDSATAARHAIVSPQVGYEIYGKALLGVTEPITPLV
ncbi:acyl-CoA dehydrogenase family protein [Nocardia macrotermitis]|uniref:Flavin-dependent monooxygenase, oxygenase subunit HsaA n=1 Tax=Nocardia macrotermitis TaxID=2585198 RepID=A0A7K0D9I9_9NOCA|nr:acyl-CoA dehydrogenase family protein [Nocardia macrotermitis]MQY22279.1 Flavin-dependent monooxygenase, oxygenase subunit HsaA [Nocardia macrotermitis]